MFAGSVQIVTLLAFTAHAVLGCCWHHPHAEVDSTNQVTADTTLSDSSAAIVGASCGHSLPEQTHASCRHQPEAKVCDASVGSTDGLVKQGCCNSSHQPSDHCISSRCCYISVKHLALNLSAGASLEGFISQCDLRYQLPSVHIRKHTGHWPFFSPLRSSGERCVYLQTWQI